MGQANAYFQFVIKEHATYIKLFPAALCIAPSTPPPPSKVELAALTIASHSILVISFRII